MSSDVSFKINYHSETLFVILDMRNWSRLSP